jgi:hypothetical protein
MFKYITIFIFSVSLFANVSCSGCNEKPKGEKLKESITVNGSKILKWEIINPGITLDRLNSLLSKVTGIDSADIKRSIKCSFGTAIDVIDPINAAISERLSVKPPLTVCTLLQIGLKRSGNLSSVRAFFMQNRLVSITYRFKKDAYKILNGHLSKRFGPSQSRELTRLSIIDNQKEQISLWKVKNDIWALQQQSNNTDLIRQDSDKLKDLPLPPKPSQKGKPVSLDDLGIKGGLEVDLSDIPDTL